MSNENWGAESWRQPDIEKGDVTFFSEHGRVIGHVDYRSHWLKMVKPEFGPICLLVKHGGGQERIRLDYKANNLVEILQSVQPDQRYLAMYSMLDLYHDARRNAVEETATRYQMAFLEGRLKKRKRNNRIYCEIRAQETVQADHA